MTEMAKTKKQLDEEWKKDHERRVWMAILNVMTVLTIVLAIVAVTIVLVRTVRELQGETDYDFAAMERRGEWIDCMPSAGIGGSNAAEEREHERLCQAAEAAGYPYIAY